jgi:hypothetical protein
LPPASSVTPAANPLPGGPPTPAAGIDPRQNQSADRQNRIDAAASSGPAQHFPAGKATSKDDLAQQLGMSSFLEFFEGSQPLAEAEGNVWYTTALPGNQWVLWNAQTLEYSRPFASLEQAKQGGNFTR